MKTAVRLTTYAITLLSMFNVGCVGWGSGSTFKQGDTTQIAKAVAESDWRGMSQIDVPGELVDPSLAGKLLHFSINGGKNIHVQAWYSDGQPKFDVTSDRSTNIDKLFGGALGLDAAKFANDQAIYDRIDRRLDRLEGLLTSYIPPGMVSGRLDQYLGSAINRYDQRTIQSSQPSTGGIKGVILDALKDQEVRAAILNAIPH